MQWLIDMVIAAIGVPPVYVDRGDPVAYDFEWADLTWDDAWHDLDLSSIIPAGASAVHLRVGMWSSSLGEYLYFQEKGNTGFTNYANVTVQVGGITIEHDIIIKLDANRKIQYYGVILYGDFANITVGGWWL